MSSRKGTIKQWLTRTSVNTFFTVLKCQGLSWPLIMKSSHLVRLETGPRLTVMHRKAALHLHRPCSKPGISDGAISYTRQAQSPLDTTRKDLNSVTVEENKISSLCSGVTPWKHASHYRARSCRIAKGRYKDFHATSKLQERERTKYCNADMQEKATAWPISAPVAFRTVQLFLL